MKSRRLRALLPAATLVGALWVAVPASGESPSERACDAQGGTFTREQGKARCVVVEEGKNPKFTETKTTTGQGNINNKQEQDTECGGTGSGKCPPGQFN